jgi:hypothetical protein
MPAVGTPAEIERTQRELIRIYDLYRDCALNLRYYGHRLATEERRNFWLQILTAVGTSVTLAAALRDLWQRGSTWLVPLLALISAIISLALPLLKTADHINLFSRLSVSYAELFYDTEWLINDIKRSYVLQDGQASISEMLFQRFARLSALDEPAPDKNLINRFRDEVLIAIPADNLWLPS